MRQASYGFETVPEGWVETRAGYRHSEGGVEIVMHGRHGRWGAIGPDGKALVRGRLTPEAVLAELERRRHLP